VFESEEVGDGGLDVVDVDGPLGDVEAEVVGRAEGNAGFDAATLAKRGLAL
jgi:hypothetical protein